MIPTGYPYTPMPPVVVDQSPKIKRQTTIIVILAVFLVASLLLNVVIGFFLFVPTITGATSSGYNDYSSLNAVYQSATIGDKVKVPVTVGNTALGTSGEIQVANNDSNVVLVIPANLQKQVRVYQGRNVVYGQITRRDGPHFIMEVDRIEP